MMLDAILSKIKTLSQASEQVTRWKADGQVIVWTNGCFDLIHLGHVKYLCQAKTLGDKLIVGVNGDASISRLKGDDRPILDEQTRLLKMAAMQMVDLVLMFDDDTPIDPILQLRPDVLVKGGDYEPDQIIGAKEVTAWGGKVHTISFEEGHSTSSILKKIQDQKSC